MAKKSKLGVASAIVVGAGAAALYAKRRVKTSRQKTDRQEKGRRNTGTKRVPQYRTR